MSEANKENKPKFIIHYKKIDFKPKSTKPVEEKKRTLVIPMRKATKYEEKFSHIVPVANDFVFNVQENSIKEYIGTIHPDIRKLVHTENISKVKTLTHGLEIATKAGLRIIVKTISRNERSIEIYEKRNKIFSGKSQCVFVKQ